MENTERRHYLWRQGLTVQNTDDQIKTRDLDCGITIGVGKCKSITAVYVPLITECIMAVTNGSR